MRRTGVALNYHIRRAEEWMDAVKVIETSMPAREIKLSMVKEFLTRLEDIRKDYLKDLEERECAT